METKSVGWQFFEDGKWWTGFDTNNHRENTEAAGIPVRDVFLNSDSQLQERIDELQLLLRQAQGMVNAATDDWHSRVSNILENKQ